MLTLEEAAYYSQKIELYEDEDYYYYYYYGTYNLKLNQKMAKYHFLEDYYML